MWRNIFKQGDSKDWDYRLIGLLGLILLFSFFSKIIHLSVPQGYYFDEIYHGFTAGEIVKGDRAVYDPWAKPPEGRAYEWTHPPLGKLFIAGTMAVVGEGFFGMRLSSVLFGVLATFLVFLLAWVLFESKRVSLVAAGLFSIDGLVFAQSRITTIDIHFLCFALATYICYVLWIREKEKLKYLIAASICLGLAVSTKWTGMYLAVFIYADCFFRWLFGKPPAKPKTKGKYATPPATHPFRTLVVRFIPLVTIPPVLYLLSYVHYFSMDYSWEQFKELQRQMWWYHTNLKATHPYQSQPWQWLLDLRPVWFYVNYATDKTILNIYNLGNPLIFWYGLITMGSLSNEGWKTRDWRIVFLVLIYFALWIAWTFSPRIMFSYHYLPALPALCIGLGIAFDRAWTSPVTWHRKAALGGVLVALGWFVLFYPQLAAIEVSRKWADSVYYWFPTWK